MQAIVFDFGNVIGYFDHRRTFSKLTAFTDLKPEEMLTRVYGTDLEDDFDAGHVSAAEFLRQFRELCRLTCDDELLRAAVADIRRLTSGNRDSFKADRHIQQAVAYNLAVLGEGASQYGREGAGPRVLQVRGLASAVLGPLWARAA